MTVDLERAKAGDERAFATLVEPFRRELQLHCYRLLGSVQDAEDLVQETLLAAWRGLDGFEERVSLRAWFYRIDQPRRAPAASVFPNTSSRHGWLDVKWRGGFRRRRWEVLIEIDDDRISTPSLTADYR
jgi:Sigma-70 region 2